MDDLPPLRAAFEDFVRTELGDVPVMDDGRYISQKINNYWRTWQAADAAAVARERERAQKLHDALVALDRAYVNLMESGRDRIMMLGGDCDPLTTMERSDPYLRAARAAIRKGP